jgi:H2-forming N5,N10-methylenetetrahydromethanopterin dehydrogenase-like enzyme
MKNSTRLARELAAASPEAAAWFLYTDLVRSLRWKRHAVAVSPAHSPVPARVSARRAWV